MSKIAYLACMVCLGLGVLIGTWIGKDTAGESVEASSGKATKSGRGGPTILVGGNEQPEPSRSGRSSPRSPGKVLADPEVVQVTIPVTLLAAMAGAGQLPDLDAGLFDGNAAVLEEYLKITELEKADLIQAWGETRDRIRQAEARASTLEELADGSVKIRLPDLSAQLGSLTTGLHDSIESVLGADRGGAFWAARQLGPALEAQGVAREYTISFEETGDGSLRYKMSETKGDLQKVWVGSSIPLSIRHLTEAENIPTRVGPSEESEAEGCSE